MRIAAAIILLSAICVQAQFGFMEPRIGGTNLVANWTFNEGSGTTAYDVSGFGNRGTLTNSPAWTNGVVGPYGLSFSGGAVTSTASNGIYADMWPVTYAVWFKTATNDASAKYIFGKGSSSQFSRAVYLLSGAIRFSLQGTPSLDRGTATSVAPVDAWMHIAVVCSGAIDVNNVTIYTNGVAVSSYPLSTPGSSYVSDASFGYTLGNRSTLDRAFIGDLDDPRIYDRALTADEVWKLYNDTKVYADGKGTHQ